MIDAHLRQRLHSLDGKLSESEGLCLAELAARVPIDQAIVEVGSFKGKSACYLGAGSRRGQGARVYAVDLWELHHWPMYRDPEVFRMWLRQVADLDLQNVVTPIRGQSATLGQLFTPTIGLLFIDGDHAYESVKADYFAWSSKVAHGGIVAFHDYENEQYGKGVRRFVDEHVRDNAEWSAFRLVDSMCVVHRTATAAPVHDATGQWTFVPNEELAEQLGFRPAQYALDLAAIVRRREDAGIYIDTHSPEYLALQVKYRHANVARPIEMRVEQICRGCLVGAACEFPRLAADERRDILRKANANGHRQWCPENAWGQQVDVVYPYVDGESRGNELRYSMRSVEQNLVGQPRIWVVGDRPDWYTGRHLPHTRLPPQQHLPRFDRAAKLRRVLKERAIGEEFVWMMDDIYLVQPMVMHELRCRWKCADMSKEQLDSYEATNNWLYEKRLTFEALASNSRPIDDLASHLPVVYEKSKLRRLMRKYKLARQPLVDDLLYLNEYAAALPAQARSILYRESTTPSVEEIRQRVAPALIMNHTDRAYTPAMEKVLSELFPAASSVEI